MKFQVKGLAKIKEAELEIKDLTVFVGKNSTNKSYMAHTVYMANKVLSQLDDGNSYKSQFNTKIFRLYLSDKGTQKYIEEIKKLIPKENMIEREIQIYKDEFNTEEYREATYDLNKIDIDMLIKSMFDFILVSMVRTINLGFNSSQEILKNLIFLIII